MKEKMIIKICIAGFIVSFTTLVVYLNMMGTGYVNINDISEGSSGSLVNVTGEINSFRKSTDGHIFLTIDDGTGEIKVVLWKNQVATLQELGMNTDEIKKGRTVNVVGEVQIYMGELEIIPVKNQFYLALT